MQGGNGFSITFWPESRRVYRNFHSVARRYPNVNICERNLGRVSANRLAKSLAPLGYSQNEFKSDDLGYYRQGSHPDLILSINLIGGGKRNETISADARIGITNYNITSRELFRYTRIPELDRRFRWGWDFVHTDEQALEFEDILTKSGPRIVDVLESQVGDELVEEHNKLIRVCAHYFNRLRAFAESRRSYEDFFPETIRRFAEHYTRHRGACPILDLRRITDIVVGVTLLNSEEAENCKRTENTLPMEDSDFQMRLSIVMSKLLFSEDQLCVDLVNRFYDHYPRR